jgi:hypothetical protein
VGITKLFRLHSDFERIRWIAGAVACGAASAAMLLTGTVHPPGGASAVLAATDPAITAMGWYFVGLVMLGTLLMVIVGLVVNNIQRQFPLYWWTGINLREFRKNVDGDDTEPGAVPTTAGVLEMEISSGRLVEHLGPHVHVTPFGVSRPKDFDLDPEEHSLLLALMERLRKREDDDSEGPERDGCVEQSPEIRVD